MWRSDMKQLGFLDFDTRLQRTDKADDLLSGDK